IQTDKYTAAWPDIPNYNDNTKWHGKTYMSSADTGAIVMFYRKLLLDKYGIAAPKDGWTFADFQSLVEKMSRKDGATTYYGYAQAGGWMGAYLRSLHWMRMDGELEWDSVVEPHKAQVMQPSILANLQYTVVDTIQRGFSPGPKTPGVGKLKIDTGTVALTPEGPWYLAYLQGNQASMKGGIPFDVVDMPTGKNGKIMTDAEIHGHVLNKASKDPDAAWSLLRFVTEDQGQQRIAAGGRMCSTPQTISNIWVPLAQKTYNFQNGAAFVRAMQQGSSPIISGAGANYDAVAGGKKPLDLAWTAMLTGTPAKDALQVANPQVQSMLDDYWKKQGTA
ncbi:MAG: ABC transporter substrate-binding protein, partial [Chloroflexota bacterium]